MRAEAHVELDDGTEVHAEITVEGVVVLAGDEPADGPKYRAVGALQAAVQTVETTLGVSTQRYVLGPGS